jgi:hypothetical protein
MQAAWRGSADDALAVAREYPPKQMRIVRRLRQGRLVEGHPTQDRVSLGLLHRAVVVVPGGPALLPVLDGPVFVLLFAGARGPDGVTVICGSQEFRICPLS